MHATPNQHQLTLPSSLAQISMLEYSSSNPTQGTGFFTYSPVATHSPISDNFST